MKTANVLSRLGFALERFSNILTFSPRGEKSFLGGMQRPEQSFQASNAVSTAHHAGDTEKVFAACTAGHYYCIRTSPTTGDGEGRCPEESLADREIRRDLAAG